MRHRLTGALLMALLALAPIVGAVHTNAASGSPGSRAPASPRTASAPATARLGIDGDRFIEPDGAPFRWRGVTSFALVEQIAHGRQAEADAYLRWARATGFTIVRVAAMASRLFRLDPADGVRALPAAIDLAARCGLAVEVVALADTADYPALDLARHVKAVGQAVLQSPRVVVALANEPYHPNQRSGLADPALLTRLRASIPPEIPVAFGTHQSDESDAYRDGDFITAHLDRGPPPWIQVARVAVLGALSRRTRKPVVNGEPIGAGEQDEPGRRWMAAEPFFALGLMNRLFEIGGTFHCQDGLFARVPGPAQRRAAEAFVDGMRLLPEDVRLVPATGLGPVESFDAGAAGSIHAAGEGERGWVVALGAAKDASPTWRQGWKVVRLVADRPGVRVWEVRQDR